MSRVPLVPAVVSAGGLVVTALVLAAIVWLLYVAVRLAQHVNAWPF